MILLAQDIEPDDTYFAIHLVNEHPDDSNLRRGLFARVGSEIMYIEALFPTYQARGAIFPHTAYVVRGALNSARYQHDEGVHIDLLAASEDQESKVAGVGPLAARFTVLPARREDMPDPESGALPLVIGTSGRNHYHWTGDRQHMYREYP